MELKKYKLGEILDVKRGASLAGEYYALRKRVRNDTDSEPGTTHDSPV